MGNRQDITVTDSGGTRIHVYTYDNMMSWRAKRGNLRVTGVDYPPREPGCVPYASGLALMTSNVESIMSSYDNIYSAWIKVWVYTQKDNGNWRRSWFAKWVKVKCGAKWFSYAGDVGYPDKQTAWDMISEAPANLPIRPGDHSKYRH